MKIGATILSLPNQIVTDDILSQMDQIEWTTFKLKSGYYPPKSKTISCLSVADMTNVSFDVNLVDSKQEALRLIEEGFEQALAHDIYEWSFGSPQLRNNLPQDKKQLIEIFKELVDYLSSKFELKQQFVIYIEPLLHENQALTNALDIYDLCQNVNQQTHSQIVLKPMIDTGTLIKQYDSNSLKNLIDFRKSIKACKAGYIEKIHLSEVDVKTPLSHKNSQSLEMLTMILGFMTNKDNLIIIYEHINIDQNHSYQYFLEKVTNIIKGDN